jgi:hypothetical protein
MKYKDVIIREASFNDKDGKPKGKLAILTYTGEGDPFTVLRDVVHFYVKTKGYHEFVDINGDNPWTRIITSDINSLGQEKFDSDKHSL